MKFRILEIFDGYVSIFYPQRYLEGDSGVENITRPNGDPLGFDSLEKAKTWIYINKDKIIFTSYSKIYPLGG